MWQSVIFVAFIITITTAVIVVHPSATNEAPTANGHTILQPLTSGQVLRCPLRIVCDNTSAVCITAYGMAQWLWLLRRRWQRKEPAAGVLCHTCCVGVCWIACVTRNVWSRQVSWITSSYPDVRVSYAALHSPEDNWGEWWVALWSGGSAFAVICISLKNAISCLCLSIYTHSSKQPAEFHFRRHQMDSLCAVVQLNIYE